MCFALYCRCLVRVRSCVAGRLFLQQRNVQGREHSNVRQLQRRCGYRLYGWLRIQLVRRQRAQDAKVQGRWVSRSPVLVIFFLSRMLRLGAETERRSFLLLLTVSLGRNHGSGSSRLRPGTPQCSRGLSQKEVTKGLGKRSGEQRWPGALPHQTSLSRHHLLGAIV